MEEFCELCFLFLIKCVSAYVLTNNMHSVTGLTLLSFSVTKEYMYAGSVS
jgi:hypothetical protein